MYVGLNTNKMPLDSLNGNRSRLLSISSILNLKLIWIDAMIYRTRGEHANHVITDAVYVQNV